MIKYIFLSLSLFAIACGGSKSIISNNFAIEMKKGPCFGSCPVFTLSIDSSGLAHYDGTRFTDLVGKHTLQLSVEEVENLNKAFEKAEFENFKDNYESEIADLATVMISYRNVDIDKTVTGKYERPEKVKELEELLETIVAKDGWVKVKRVKSAEEIAAEEQALADAKAEEEKEEIIDNELIVKFKEGTPLARWIRKYEEYGLNVQKPLSDDKWIWLMDFRKSKIEPTKLMEMLKTDKNIESIEFNKPVEKR